MHTDTHTYIHTHTHADTQTHQTDRHTDTQSHRHTLMHLLCHTRAPMHHKQRTQTTQHTTHTTHNTEHITYATQTQYAPNPTNEVFRNRLDNTVSRKGSGQTRTCFRDAGARTLNLQGALTFSKHGVSKTLSAARLGVPRSLLLLPPIACPLAAPRPPLSLARRRPALRPARRCRPSGENVQSR